MSHDSITEYLKKRGWPKKDIAKSISILQKADKKKPRHIFYFERFLYWFALFIGILGNLIISIFLIPLLLVLN